MHIKNSALLTFLTVFATQCHDVTDEEFATQCKVKEELSNKEIEDSILKATASCFDSSTLEIVFKEEALKNGDRVFQEPKINTIRACIHKQFNEENKNKQLNESQNKLKKDFIDLQTGNAENKTQFYSNMKTLRESNSGIIDFNTKIQKDKEDFNEGRAKYKSTNRLQRWLYLKLSGKNPCIDAFTTFEDIGYRYEYDQANKKE